MTYRMGIKFGSLDVRDPDGDLDLERVEYVESIDVLDALQVEFSLESEHVGATWNKVKPGTAYTVQFKNASTGANLGSAVKGVVVDVQIERVNAARFRFTVTGLEELCRLRGSAAEVSWADAPDKIVKAIATAAGLTATADASNVVAYTTSRGSMDDLAFLKAMANRFHYRLGTADGKILFKRRTVADATVPLSEDDVQQCSLRASVHGLASEVTVWGRDPKQNGWFQEKVTSIPRGISGTTMGLTMAKTVFKNASIEIQDAGCPSPGAAQERATAELRNRAEKFVAGTLVLDGNPKVRTGTDVDVDLAVWPFTGKFRVREARHLEDRVTGYRTFVEFYSDSLPNLV